MLREAPARNTHMRVLLYKEKEKEMVIDWRIKSILLYSSGIPVGAVFIYRSISPPTIVGAVTRMTTVRAQGRSCVYGVKKSLRINEIIPNHLLQMFHCSILYEMSRPEIWRHFLNYPGIKDVTFK